MVPGIVTWNFRPGENLTNKHKVGAEMRVKKERHNESLRWMGLPWQGCQERLS